MAIDFDSGEARTLDAAVITAHPLSVSCLVHADDVTFSPILSLLSNNTATDGWYLEFGGSGFVVASIANNDTDFSGGVTASGLATGTWGQVGGMYTSATSRHGILNGTKGTEDTISIAPSLGTARFGLNGLYRSTLISTGDQRIAEVGVWNRALSDAEWVILAGSGGVFGSPLLIPSGLVAYYISDGAHAEIGTALTDVGTPTGFTHPSVLYPATGGAAAHHYRTQMVNA